MLIRADHAQLPIADDSVHTVVTSPGYWGLRHYGDDDREIGRASLKEYVEETLAWTAECWRVMTKHAVLWLNIADTRSGSGGAGGDYNAGGSKEGMPKWRQGSSGLAARQDCLVPERVALAMQADGWLCIKRITWDKQAVRPEDINHVRRPLFSSEAIFMFTKGPKYRFFGDRLDEKGDVWHFNAAKGKRRGMAPFPDELARRCILASTEPGDVVLDPSSGSGTTMRVASELGRLGIGTDLYVP